MEQRAIGTSDLEVSILGLGTASFGGSGSAHGLTDDNESIEAIHTAIESGITLFETDPDYGEGHSESLLGKAVRGHRDNIVLLSRQMGTGEELAPDHPALYERIVARCERTLRRMRCDALDILAFGPPAPDSPIRETMRAMTALRDRGLIRAIGAANLDMEQIASALEFGPVHCLQTEFSMRHHRAANDLIPFCIEHDIAVLACGPFAGGVLAGSVEGGRAPTDQRSIPSRRGAQRRVSPAMVERLAEIARRIDKPPAQLVLNWTAAQPGITSVIFGAKRPSRVREDAAAAGWSIDPQIASQIQRMWDSGGET